MSLLTSASAGSSDSMTTTCTLNSTGAKLLVAGGHYFDNWPVTFVDSLGLTWQLLTLRSTGVNGYNFQGYYCINPPSVGAGHQFDFGSTSLVYPSVTVLAFDDVVTFDSENGAVTAGGTSLNSGSVTPATNGAVVVAWLTVGNSSGPSVSGGSLAIAESVAYSAGAHMIGVAAYEIQGTAAARSAAFVWTGSSPGSAAIAAFAAAGGAGGGFNALLIAP